MSLLLCGAMVFSLCPQTASAVSIQRTAADSSSLCEHHTEHNGDCGYSEGSEGTPCTHQHTDECYIEVTNCVHEHDEGCYLETGDSVSDNTATPSNAEEREPEHCNHVCSEENGCIMEKLDCQHEHDSECGYSPAVEGTPCGYVCEICNPADSEEPEAECVCEILCAEENINTDCPICGAEDADLTQCAGKETNEQVKTVQELIDALPTAEKLNDMSKDEQNEAYNALQAAYDAYEGLTDEQKAQIVGAEIFESLFTFFNGMTNALATVNGVNYLDADGNELTADNVIVVDSTTTSWLSGNWYVVNSTVSIDRRINTGSDVHLILADGCHLTASQGINVNAGQSLTIYGQDGTNGVIGKLSATGGHSYAGIGSGKGSDSGAITINGGDVNATGGYCAAGIGGGGDWNSDSNNAGGNVGAITINGGIVKAKGGYRGAGIGGGNMKPSSTVVITGGVITAIGSSSMGIGSGYTGGSGSFSTGENGKAVILASGGNPIGDTSNQENWGGIIFLGTEGKVYGDQTLSTDVAVSDGGKLTIPEGTTLTISSSGKLTNNGTVENNGTIHNEGTITGNISFEGTGIITGIQPSMPEVSYLAWNGSKQNWENGTCSDYIPVDTGTISWGVDTTQERWYVVSGDVTVSGQITVTGNVHLILTDNCVLTVKNGIAVNGGNSLTIYAQSTGEDIGRLTATRNTLSCAGIGNTEGFSGGAITIYGGSITATGGTGGAGIGGSTGRNGGEITIYGGSVTANGGIDGAGIGGGCRGDGGAITISGGTVKAVSSANGAGIGGGSISNGGTILIRGRLSNGYCFCNPGSDSAFMLRAQYHHQQTGCIVGLAPILYQKHSVWQKQGPQDFDNQKDM